MQTSDTFLNDVSQITELLHVRLWEKTGLFKFRPHFSEVSLAIKSKPFKINQYKPLKPLLHVWAIL